MKDILEYKNIPADENSITDIDEKKGIVTGYFSVFGNIDSDRDVITKGAYKKTLTENFRRVKHLYQHDPFQPLSGTNKGNLVVREDAKGLYFESTISQTSWGRDAIQLYADGVIDEQSVGFQTVKSVDREKYREITEIKLWEGSAVTWAANDLAQTSGVKSYSDVNLLSKRMDTVLKSLRNGKYENEDIFDQLEFYFKQLQQNYIDLLKQSTQPAPQAVEPVEITNVFDNFIKTLP